MIRAEQVRAARAMLALSQEELASLAGVARRTILRLENEEAYAQPKVLDSVQRALEAEGARFQDREDGCPGVFMLAAAREAVADRLVRKVRRTGGGVATRPS